MHEPKFRHQSAISLSRRLLQQKKVDVPVVIPQSVWRQPQSGAPAQLLQMQKEIGNQHLVRQLQQEPSVANDHISSADLLQRSEADEIAGMDAFDPSVLEELEEDEPMQQVAQRMEIGASAASDTAVASANQTGMPDNLKHGVEQLSGMDMSDVRVHYNSSAPSQVNALAYAQGTDIHVAPGQEQHLPHEAWHVVQQKQGRVQPTMQLENGVSVNDNEGLENEATVLGNKAMNLSLDKVIQAKSISPAIKLVLQRTIESDIEDGNRALYNSIGYQDQVIPRLEKYVQNIQQLDHGEYDHLAGKMSAGYKSWSENYYNKTQAYIFEAQLVSQDFTKFAPGNAKKGTNTFGMLGTDTDLEPDVSVYTENAEIKNDKVEITGKDYKAVEIKASTSSNYATVDKLAADGMQQLRKRQNTGNYSSLQIVINIDNQTNPWPITLGSLTKNFNNDYDQIPLNTWQARVMERFTAMKGKYGITLPLSVFVHSNGYLYDNII